MLPLVQNVIPIIVNLRNVGFMSGQIIQCSVIRLLIDTPKAGVPHVSEAGAELISEQPENPKHDIGVCACVGHNLSGLKMGLLPQDDGQQNQRIPYSSCLYYTESEKNRGSNAANL